MKTNYKFLLVFSFVLIRSIASLSAAENISQLYKERVDKYILFSSFNGASDSAKLISANQILELDNKIIAASQANDSLLISLENKTKAYEAEIAESKSKSFIMHIVSGGLLLVLVIALVVIVILNIRSKSKLKTALVAEKNKSADLEADLNKIKSSFTALENNINEEKSKHSEVLNSKLQELLSLQSANEKLSLEISSLKSLLEKSTSDLDSERKKAEISSEMTAETEKLKNQNNELALELTEIIKQKESLESELEKLKVSSAEDKNNKALFEELQCLVELNKKLTEKVSHMDYEITLFEQDLEDIKSHKDQLIEEIEELEKEIQDQNKKNLAFDSASIKDMFEKNIESLVIMNTKLSVDKERLEKALRMREPEDVLTEKIKALTNENFNLQLDLEDEKNYTEKLHNKLDKYLDELEKQDLELELLNMKISDRTIPETRQKYDAIELNLMKIEKLNRLKEINAISEEEFIALKQDIISQIN